MLSRCIVCCLIIVSTSLAADDLLDVYALAQQNDPEIRAAAASVAAGREQAAIGSAAIRPQVSANYGYSRANNNTLSQFPISFSGSSSINTSVTDTRETTSQWSITASQSLFDANRWYSAKEAGFISAESEQTFTLAQQNLILRTTKAYFDVLRARNNLDVSQAQLEANRWQLDQAKARFDLGAVAITDVHQAQSAYDLSNALLLTDRAALANAKRALSLISGVAHERLASLKADFTAEPPSDDAEHWQLLARANNANIKLAAASRDAAHAAAKAAGGSRLPSVEAQLSLYDTDVDINEASFGDYANETDGNSIAISISLPLYSGGELSARKRQAHHYYNRSVEQYAGTVRTIEQQTQTAYSDVDIAVARIKAFKQALRSAQSALDSIDAGYANGTNTIIDLLASQRAFYSAQRDYNNAKLDYILLYLQLAALAGTIDTASLSLINNQLIE